MLKFKHKNLVPPGNKYFYLVPETGMEFEYVSENGLYTLLREHYYSNNIPLPERVMDLVEHYMCLHMPEGTCVGSVDDETERRANVVTFQETKARTMDYNLDTSPEPTVLNARVTACLECNRNIRGLCGTCTGLKYSVAWMLRGRRAPSEEALHVCAIDGGFLPIKVFADQTSIPKITDVEHVGCWAHEQVTDE